MCLAVCEHLQVQGLRSLVQLVALDLSANKLVTLEAASLPVTLRFLQVRPCSLPSPYPCALQAFIA